jgi:uncharacterized membrane protein
MLISGAGYDFPILDLMGEGGTLKGIFYPLTIA